MTARKKKTIILAVVAVLLMGLIIWTIWGNTALELNPYTVSADRLPAAFEGYRVAHVSDLHNVQIGEENEELLEMLREAEPDLIAITGDLVDSRHTDVEAALRFAQEAVKIAPCYFVTGNHEGRLSEYPEIKKELSALGVTVLDDEKVTVEKDGQTITLIGINDPSFQTDYRTGDAASVVRTQLQELTGEGDGFTLLLSHRPELFEVYTDFNVDLVLSGHAHGGQFRMPFVGGVIAPNQGWFPEYETGLYTEGSTHMIVSRGIGNSLCPIRFNNRPEVILVELGR